MAFALVTGAHVAGGGDGTDTAAIDTTGVTLLVAHSTFSQGTTPTPADSKTNTWQSLTVRNAAASFAGRLFYVLNPSVGTGHTFKMNGASSFPSIFVAGFSGTSPTWDQESGTGGNGGTVQPGSLTQTGLFVVGLGHNSATGATIDSSFTILDALDVSGGVYFGGALAYRVTTGAQNPTWSTSGGNWTTEMATFTEGGAATTRGTPFGHRGTAFNGGRTFNGIINKIGKTWQRQRSLLHSAKISLSDCGFAPSFS